MTAATPPNPGTNLDPWYSHYAARTAGLSVSEVRALFAVASRPEVVSLAGTATVRLEVVPLAAASQGS